MLKPMLAGKVEDPGKLTFPLLATPKLDGIRCLTIEVDGKTVAVSRKLKPIPNDYIREKLEAIGPGFDGELMLRGDGDFSSVSSAVMRQDGKPDFVYFVFDIHNDTSSSYIERLENLAVRLGDPPGYVEALIPTHVHDVDIMLAYEEEMLAKGYEGVMVRSIEGLYKYGRSTVKQAYLLKLKRFKDSEAEIIGCIEELHNGNEATKDNLGRTERSTAKAGKSGKSSLGAFRCVMLNKGVEVEFKIGTGFTAKQREDFWWGRAALFGKIVKFKYQDIGTHGRPRFPVFLGFRHEDDMS